MKWYIKRMTALLTILCTFLILAAPGSIQAIRAPFETGLHVQETYLTFKEKLIKRPKTDAIVIHHVAQPAWDVDAYYIHRLHQRIGWAGIGYQYVIRKDGTIERGRPFDMVGAHSYGNNYHSLGICVVGNLEVDEPTTAQMDSLTRLVTALCRYYKLTPDEFTVVGHRDYNSTDCPGKNLYKLLPQLRIDVQNELDKDHMAAPVKADTKDNKKHKKTKKRKQVKQNKKAKVEQVKEPVAPVHSSSDTVVPTQEYDTPSEQTVDSREYSK